MELQLNEGYVRPRARLDHLFLMKKEIVKVCRIFAEQKQKNPKTIPILQYHPVLVSCRSYIRQYYYDLLDIQRMDKRIHKLLFSSALNQREDYHLIQFSDHILHLLNKSHNKLRFLSPPLVYANNERRGRIITLYPEKFWARVEEDIFGHQTLIHRINGVEKYFGCFISETSPYPTFAQPFLTVSRDVAGIFDRYNTTFDEMFHLLKGLFNMWYGFRF